MAHPFESLVALNADVVAEVTVALTPTGPVVFQQLLGVALFTDDGDPVALIPSSLN
jgi:hypothetical protein